MLSVCTQQHLNLPFSFFSTNPKVLLLQSALERLLKDCSFVIWWEVNSNGDSWKELDQFWKSFRAAHVLRDGSHALLLFRKKNSNVETENPVSPTNSAILLSM